AIVQGNIVFPAWRVVGLSLFLYYHLDDLLPQGSTRLHVLYVGFRGNKTSSVQIGLFCRDELGLVDTFVRGKEYQRHHPWEPSTQETLCVKVTVLTVFLHGFFRCIRTGIRWRVQYRE